MLKIEAAAAAYHEALVEVRAAERAYATMGEQLEHLKRERAALLERVEALHGKRYQAQAALLKLASPETQE